jgi:hypothetical protein
MKIDRGKTYQENYAGVTLHPQYLSRRLCRKASQYVFIVNILSVRIKALKIVDKIAFDSFFYD